MIGSSRAVKTIDEYLAKLSGDRRAALEKLRRTLRAARFQPDEPLPASLVRKLVRYRIAENAAQRLHPARGASRRR